MSTEYLFDPLITESQFLDAAKSLGMRPDYSAEDAHENWYPVGAEGIGWVWVSVFDDDRHIQITVYGLNDDKWLYEVAKQLNVNVWGEHDEEFDELADTNGSYVTLTMTDLSELAHEIVEFNSETGECTTIKDKNGWKH